jgi:hypothetical protein
MLHCERMGSAGQRIIDDRTHSDTDYDSRLGFVGVDKKREIVIMDMQVWPKITRRGYLDSQRHI